MTAGQDALAEIARLETAAILTTPRDTPATHSPAAPSAETLANVVEQLRHGNLIRTITRTTGLTDDQVTAIADSLNITPRRDFRRLRVVRGGAA